MSVNRKSERKAKIEAAHFKGFSQPVDEAAVEPRVVIPETGPRSESDLALLLAELDHTLAAYGEPDGASASRTDLARRTALLFHLELERGPLAIARDGRDFSSPVDGELPCRPLPDTVVMR